MPSEIVGRVVILGTGGTIAGTAATANDNIGYAAAQRSVAQLVAGVTGLDDGAIEAEQVAQLDSKDMDAATWQRLAQRAAHHLARADVHGLVVTHGTDTLEETAWWLHRVLAPAKPLVLTAAMRPATALAPDGPQNLRDAVMVARWPGAQGVLAVMAGTVYAGHELRKRHPYRLDAMGAGDAGPLGVIEEGRVRQFRAWPTGQALGLERVSAPAADWPWVAIVASHAGADARAVRALRAAGVQGLVVAATGNGSVHEALEPALREAEAAGVPVWRTTRCAEGQLVGTAHVDTAAAALTPWQARAAMQLWLLAGRPADF